MSLKTVWYGMRKRCYNNYPKGYGYNSWYRDKGIKICDEWLNNFSAFEKWAIENGYEKGLSIDRIDRDKDYEPNNCRWVSLSENSKHANHDRQEKGKSGSGGRYSIAEVYYGNRPYRIVEIGFSLSEAKALANELEKKARKEGKMHWCYGDTHYGVTKTQKNYKKGKWISVNTY